MFLFFSATEARVRDVPGAGAHALLDQHVPQLGAGPSAAHAGAQRRDQHAARQRQPHEGTSPPPPMPTDFFSKSI